ncbi:hypothetical protein DPX16_10109 [Anabarilius grahami]|uniref:Uncharacterized protein n=1 Tax=Anabarilius grahami TaxID=495550 RepID=A0A3N0XX25_ANAGA|nr:hypothetical protein DPX16_10109 [Anabarilius grahami]
MSKSHGVFNHLRDDSRTRELSSDVSDAHRSSTHLPFLCLRRLQTSNMTLKFDVVADNTRARATPERTRFSNRNPQGQKTNKANEVISLSALREAFSFPDRAGHQEHVRFSACVFERVQKGNAESPNKPKSSQINTDTQLQYSALIWQQITKWPVVAGEHQAHSHWLVSQLCCPGFVHLSMLLPQ